MKSHETEEDVFHGEGDERRLTGRLLTIRWQTPTRAYTASRIVTLVEIEHALANPLDAAWLKLRAQAAAAAGLPLATSGA